MNVEIRPEEPHGFWHLFGAQKKVYPAKVRGTFRTTKWLAMTLLLGLYYLLPWVRWERGAGAPDQAILVDVIGRKFYFFFIEIWPQEVYYFTGLLLLAAMGLFFATTLLGRVWCGYACPQTVWTDLFVHVERWIEGDRVAQQRLATAAWGFDKVCKKLSKHLLWLMIGLATGGAWVFYFEDAPTLWAKMLQGQFDFVPTFWMVFLTFSTYLMAGFAREQVCTYMCPYARFQGAMFDEESLIVSYDTARGEPRGKAGNGGDCVDCGRCVAVCPVGIDIRNGQQYQCINCALCVDACDAIMAKLGQKQGLIRYNTLHGDVPEKVGIAGIFRYVHIFRPRVLVYGGVMVLASGVMLWGLLTKPMVDVTVQRQRNPLFIKMSSGEIRNAFTLHVVNKTWAEQVYNLKISGLDGAKMALSEHGEGTGDTTQLVVKAGKVGQYRVLVDVPRGALAGEERHHVDFVLENERFSDRVGSVFMGPEEE